MSRSASRALAAVLALPCLAPTALAQAQTRQAGEVAGGVVSLNVSEGRLVRLDRDAANVLVADSAIADVQVVAPGTLYVYGRRPGQTTLSATGADGGVVAQLTLRVQRGSAAARSALPPGSGGVTLGFAGNRAVVRGPVGDLGAALDVDAAARAYNASPLPPLDRTGLAGTQQVTLRVRIAEVSRTDLNELGINWDVLANPGSFAFSLMTGSLLGNLTGSLGSGFGSAAAGATGTSGSFGTLGAGLRTRRVNVNALVNALQSEGMLMLLAEPNLTALSGETASFLAGGEIPIPVPQAFGVTTVQYRPFGVQLAFTPVVLPAGRLALRVRSEVSEVSNANSVTVGGTTAPSFINRRVETNVEMASGQTLAIAGLFQRSQQTSLNRFPLLGDLPVLGALFRSARYQRSETELVILITPLLSRPVADPDALPLPTDPVARARPGGPGSAVQAGFVVD